MSTPDELADALWEEWKERRGRADQMVVILKKDALLWLARASAKAALLDAAKSSQEVSNYQDRGVDFVEVWNWLERKAEKYSEGASE